MSGRNRIAGIIAGNYLGNEKGAFRNAPLEYEHLIGTQNVGKDG
jgi:hypothetical protein